jgi:FAD/FMN-containing dehydrogenase
VAIETRPRTLDQAALAAFAGQLRGDLVLPDSPDYDAARTIYNATIDKRPAVIARCRDAADVIAAVRFARTHNLPLAIRGGGHNVAGTSLAEDGLVIDLSAMKGVWVDPSTRTARVEGGATWGDVDHATHAFGLATPSGIISTTGVGGLTLGGGFGHISRAYGLSCDNLLSADVVTADGRFVTASADEHPELFWALRGGGGNFGVVTSFEFQLHPVHTVYGGPIFYPVEHTERLFHAYRAFMRQAPDELSAFFSFHQGPPAPFVPEYLHFVPMVAIVFCYCGPIERGEAMLRPMRELVEPALDLAGAIPYPALNSMFDDLYVPGLHHYWKADYVPELTDDAIAIHSRFGPQVPSLHSTMHLYPQTGAIQRVGQAETAYAYRDVEFVHNIVAIDMEAAQLPRDMEWMQAYWEALHPHAAAGAYVNFMMADEGRARVQATYRGNYARLQQIKQQWDPDNLFRTNQNIAPSS